MVTEPGLVVINEEAACSQLPPECVETAVVQVT
jgi:hypothetical protein